jgi:hypothetical protein
VVQVRLADDIQILGRGLRMGGRVTEQRQNLLAQVRGPNRRQTA